MCVAGAEFQIHVFFISALTAAEWSVSYPCPFLSWNLPAVRIGQEDCLALEPVWMLRAEYDQFCSLLLELVPRFPVSGPVTYQSSVWATPALSLTIFYAAITSALQTVYLFHQQSVPTFGTKLLPPSPFSYLRRLTFVSANIAAAQWYTNTI